MMQQYLEVKADYEGYVLMYRLGDFYECFFEDAVEVARVLELTLTKRDCGGGKRAAMCGVPFHKSDLYVGRLVEKGYKVAICEQVEDPKSASGLVKRDVVRVVTPGTITDNSLLREDKNNFLCAVAVTQESYSVAFADISTGEISVTHLSGEDIDTRLINELSAFSPAEIILNVPASEIAQVAEFAKDRLGAIIADNQKLIFTYERARDVVRRFFPNEYDKLPSAEAIMAIGALAFYITDTQKTDTAFAKEINVYSKGQFMELDYNTRRNLELVENMRGKEKRGSLLWVLDKTKTAMGARQLRSWILRPLLDPVKISHRQSTVGDLKKSRNTREDIADVLSKMLDLERLTAKTVYGTANAKDLRAICNSIELLPMLKELISQLPSPNAKKIYREFDVLGDIYETLSTAIVDDPPLTIREGGMIRDGYDKDVDYFRSIKENGSDIMAAIEEREKEATGIKTLKVTYNKVFGYYIEVTKAFLDSVPDRYIRKQTLTNCERYITQELKEMETAILGAEEKLAVLEYEIFNTLRLFIAENSERICKTALSVAEIDVYASLAEVADKNSYICPEVDLSSDIIIKEGRHPVVERFVKDSYFVPNDTVLNTASDRVMIITGPNMAGKSTYMRQVALITLMAQIGSFVPAKEAKIGIVDKLFTRVGASDDLASGQSTFMLEMNEVATILKNATKKSLIIYDEVGRGTSTFDGMAIARAVLEYTQSKKIGAKTLFATHYHELISMEDEFEGIVNYNIAAKKRADSIIFLRKIVKGGTDDSYGIEVAKLAGVPNEVVKRAKEILAEIESDTRVVVKKETKTEDIAFDLFSGMNKNNESEVCDKLKALDLNTITPIEAMNFVYELKNILSK